MRILSIGDLTESKLVMTGFSVQSFTDWDNGISSKRDNLFLGFHFECKMVLMLHK